MATPPPNLGKFVNRLTAWVGSPSSMFVHSIIFLGALLLPLLGVDSAKVLLVLTTIVSLEAIYLSIFIQYSVNQHSEALTEVASDIDEVTEDVKEISTDVEELSSDVEDISSDVSELATDVEDISENLEEHLGDDEPSSAKPSYEHLEQQVRELSAEVERLKHSA